MHRVRVIIVEDNPLVALDIAEEVEGAGAEVVGISHSGALASALIEALQPDLVFLDYTLSDEVTGADVAIELGRTGPVCVFVTGVPESLPARLAERWPVLSKPITGAEIRRVLEYVRGLSDIAAPTDG